MKVKLLLLTLLATISLKAATITILVDFPNKNQQLSGYYLHSISESGLIVSEDVGLVRKIVKKNLTDNKQYEFWIIPYYVNNKGTIIYGEESNHILYNPKPKQEDKAPNKPKIRIVE